MSDTQTMTTTNEPKILCAVTDSSLDMEIVHLSGRWDYRITRFTRTAVATLSAENGWILAPGVYHGALTQLLRDGHYYGAMPKAIIEATPEARDAAVAKRIDGARRRKAGEA